jgi:hypothetical protein
MKFHFYFKIFGLLLALLFFTACEENFWGYNYDAPALINTSRIKGTITNTFTGEPVSEAIISINDQVTMSDESGNYLLNYIIPDDAEPNKLETGYVSVSAPKYLDYNGSLIIYPFENYMDIELKYAAPIVKNAMSDGDTTQAIIIDYQGVEDIDSVSVTYHLSISGYVFQVKFDMVYEGQSDNITAYFQHIRSDLEEFEIGSWWFMIGAADIWGSWFMITAKDKSGNTNQEEFTINPDDSMLFRLIH